MIGEADRHYARSAATPLECDDPEMEIFPRRRKASRYVMPRRDDCRGA